MKKEGFKKTVIYLQPKGLPTEEMKMNKEEAIRYKISLERNNMANKIIFQLRDFPGSTARELFLLSGLSDSEYDRALGWATHKGKICQISGLYYLSDDVDFISI